MMAVEEMKGGYRGKKSSTLTYQVNRTTLCHLEMASLPLESQTLN